MRLVAAHGRAITLELARYPSFAVPTLAFPALFFLFFGRPRVDAARPEEALASYAGFAVLAVAFFQFGVGIAVERDSSWERFLRALPLRARTRFAARVFSAGVFAILSAAVVAGAATLTTEASLSPLRWLALAAALLAGVAPFALLGTALGYLVSPRGALPIANILYLLLSFLGGLWTVPDRLPPGAEAVSPFVPTRQFGDVLRGAVDGDLWAPLAWALLGGWTLAFGALAVWAYARDEGRRWR